MARRQKRSGNNETKATVSWHLLPGELLFSVLLKLSFAEYAVFSAICNDWRKVAEESKEIFMKSRPPLVLYKAKHAKKVVQIDDVLCGRHYKKMLPGLAYKKFLGVSGGYLITLEGESMFEVVNLLTRDILQFPYIPYYFMNSPADHTKIRPILFRITTGFVMVFVDRRTGRILIARSLCAQLFGLWCEPQNPFNICGIVDVAIFEGKIYFLTRDLKFGELTLSPTAVLQPLETDISFPTPPSSLQLVTSNKCLYMLSHQYVFDVDACAIDILLLVYKFDASKLEWTRVYDLGKNALFLSDAKSSAITDPTDSGGQSNCVYVSKGKRVSVFQFNGTGCTSRKITDIKIFNKTKRALEEPHLWYIPHFRMAMDEI